jgi:hypothetical protein
MLLRFRKAPGISLSVVRQQNCRVERGLAFESERRSPFIQNARTSDLRELTANSVFPVDKTRYSVRIYSLLFNLSR